MKRLLLDVNVLLDVLLDRDPWAESASALWAAVESGKARGFIPAHGVTTIHTLMRKARGGAFADRGVSDLLVTRDPAGFRGSPVEVASPGEALARLGRRRKAAPARR